MSNGVLPTITKYSSIAQKSRHMTGLDVSSLEWFNEFKRIEPTHLFGEVEVGDDIGDGYAVAINPGLFIINSKVDINALNDPSLLMKRYKSLKSALKKYGFDGKFSIPFKYFRLTFVSNHDMGGYDKKFVREPFGTPFNPVNASHIYVDEMFFETQVHAMMAKTIIETILRDIDPTYLPLYNWVVTKIKEWKYE